MQAFLSSAALFTLLLHVSITFVKGTEDSEEEESGGTSPTARLARSLVKLKKKADKNGPPQSLWTVARQNCRGLFGAGLYCAALNGLRSTWAIALPLQAISMGFSKQNIGLAVAFSRAFDVTMTLSAAGYISDTFGRKASGCPTLCLMASSFLWLPFATTTEGLMLAAMMWGIGNGLSGGVANTFATGLAPADCRTEFLGLWKTTTAVGTLCLPPMFGAVSDATGSLRMACLITGTLALFMIGWLWIVVPGESNGEPEPQPDAGRGPTSAFDALSAALLEETVHTASNGKVGEARATPGSSDEPYLCSKPSERKTSGSPKGAEA